jgi:Cu+-exporting ATPase
MFRRQFVQLITLVGAGGLATIAAKQARGSKTSTYRVKGFSCVTCAVGLDAMLERQKGVAWSRSSYPDGTVVVKFDPEEMTDASLRAFINGMGFTVEDESAD